MESKLQVSDKGDLLDFSLDGGIATQGDFVETPLSHPRSLPCLACTTVGLLCDAFFFFSRAPFLRVVFPAVFFFFFVADFIFYGLDTSNIDFIL